VRSQAKNKSILPQKRRWIFWRQALVKKVPGSRNSIARTPKAPMDLLAPSARQKSIRLQKFNCLQPKSAEGSFGAKRSSKKYQASEIQLPAPQKRRGFFWRQALVKKIHP